MNAKRVAAAEGVILAAQKTRKTAAGVAAVLEAACLLQSPEVADEMKALRGRVAELEAAAYGNAGVRLLGPVGQIRHLHAALSAQMSRADTLDRLCRERDARVAELEAERHTTNEILSDTAVSLRLAGDRIAELEAAAAKAGALHTKHADSGHCQYDGERWPCQTLTHLQRPGSLAEQRHLMDPLDHACEALAPRNLPDPIAYGPTGYRCGCGKDAHSNLVPCQPAGPTTIETTGSVL